MNRTLGDRNLGDRNLADRNLADSWKAVVFLMVSPNFFILNSHTSYFLQNTVSKRT